MPTAFVTRPGAVVARKSRRILVRKHDLTLAEWKLSRLTGLCLWGPVQITRPALGALLKAGIGVFIVAADGQPLGQVIPALGLNALLRLEQLRAHLDPARRLDLARTLCLAKVANARALLLRFHRNHPIDLVAEMATRLQAGLARIAVADSIESLLGFEGHAARLYFAAFRQMCRGALPFNGRSTRPPGDPVNALLSLGYTFLVRELTGIVAAIGFDPYFGFLHSLDYGRPGLALDLAEPFRPAVIDRFTLSLVNNRVFSPADFRRLHGGWFLNRDGFARFAEPYERYLSRRTVDPQTLKRFSLRQHLRLQADRFAAFLQHKRDPYYFTIEG